VQMVETVVAEAYQNNSSLLRSYARGQ